MAALLTDCDIKLAAICCYDFVRGVQLNLECQATRSAFHECVVRHMKVGRELERVPAINEGEEPSAKHDRTRTLATSSCSSSVPASTAPSVGLPRAP